MLNFTMSHAEFLANHFEQKPAHFPGALRESALSSSTSSAMNSVMNWRDVDSVLNSIEPDEQRVQLFMNGQVPPETFLEDVFEFGRGRKRINKFFFYSLLQNGATLVLNQIENSSAAAKRLCVAIGQFTRQPTTSNAYVSFGGSGPFGKHWDTHDVFAIQLAGRKRWQLYEPTLPLPLSHQLSRNATPPPASTPAFECVLEVGDVLYIPRGWWHDVTSLNTDSLHLSVGTYPPAVLDYVMWVCRFQLPELIDARRGCTDRDTLASTLEQVTQLLGKAVLDKNNFNEFLRTHQAQERLIGDFNTAFMLDKSAHYLRDTCSVSLCSVYSINPALEDIPVNGGRLKLSEPSQAIVALLNQSDESSWSTICAQLPQYAPAVLREAALDLSRYDIIRITATD